MTGAPTGPAAPVRSLARVVWAEWIKFRTVRSSFWTLVVAAVVTVGAGAALLPSGIDEAAGPGVAAARAVEEGWWFFGLHLSILAVSILGVLVASAEYRTGTMRATLAAVPSRPRVLAAKVVSFTGVTLVAGVLQAAAAFLVAVPILADRSINVPLTDPAAWRGVAVATLAVVGAGLFGLGAGLVVRGAAGAIGAVVLILWIIPELTLFVPDSWGHVVKVLPANAMYAMFTPVEQMQLLSRSAAGVVFFGYVAVLLGVAGVLFARRDA